MRPIGILLAFVGNGSDAALKWVHRLGGPGLILLGIADNAPIASAPPGSEDLFVIMLAAQQPHWWAYYALMATIGEVIGGYLTYRIAEKGGQQALEKKVGKARAEKLYKGFEKRGALTIFSGAILPPPFPFTSVLMAAGVMQYPRKRLLSALTGGRALRFLIGAYFGRAYAEQMIRLFSRYYYPMMYVLIALAITSGIAAAIYYFKSHRPKAQQDHREADPAHKANVVGQDAKG
jgi:membrane protein YqaA with SNARE-associated domain